MEPVKFRCYGCDCIYTIHNPKVGKWYSCPKCKEYPNQVIEEDLKGK